MKKILSFVLVLCLCLSLVPSVFAEDTDDFEGIAYVSVMNENSEFEQYFLEDGVDIEIPIYAIAEDSQTRAYAAVATLNVSFNESINMVTFIFTPLNAVIGLLTVGFTGTIKTFASGNAYGSNTYALPTMTGGCTAYKGCTGTVSGSYYVVGFDPISVLYAFTC